MTTCLTKRGKFLIIAVCVHLVVMPFLVGLTAWIIWTAILICCIVGAIDLHIGLGEKRDYEIY